MPLARIDLIEGRPETEIAAIGNAIQRALMECLDVPKRDHFQIITEHVPGRLVYGSDCLDVKRSDGIVMIQVNLSAGRTAVQKRAFHAQAAGLLARDAMCSPKMS